MNSFPRLLVTVLIVSVGGNLFVRAQETNADAAAMPLIDFSSPNAQKQVGPTKGVPPSMITLDKTGISMGFPIQPAPHSGVIVTSVDGKPWNLSAYGHVSVKVTNTDKTILPFVMHVVNGAEGRTQELNTEAIDIPPGETKVLTVYFGYQYGFEPSAAFDPTSITEIYLFLYDTTQPHGFRIEELKAGGVPGEKPVFDPDTLSSKPQNGIILGKGAMFDPAKQVEGGTAKVSSAPNDALTVNFTGGTEESIKIKPAIGMWDLTDANELRVKFKNIGQAPVTPTVEVGPLKVSATSPLAPGAETEIVAPFSAMPSASDAKALPPFESDKAKEFSVLSDATPGAKNLLVTSIVADMATDDIPDWLGKKPPVDGDWTQTFDEEFNGPALDFKKWNIYANNRLIASRSWNHNHNSNRLTHFSKDNVILENGTVILRYEKKTGKNNDADKGQPTDYASGVLSTFGKWTQRYGYFESRMKLPKAPGLWASFTLMPEPVTPAIPSPTSPVANPLLTAPGTGGLEFDLMNLLSHWGTNRFSVAERENLHGDKILVAQNAYIRPDKDGYITTGLLWTPGVAVFYNNGKELYRWENPKVSDVQSCLRYDMVIGGSDNNHVDDAKLPTDFTIDYVRAWQRKDLASPNDGPRPNQGSPNEMKN